MQNLGEKAQALYFRKRAFAYIDKLPSIDILIVDEFYKVRQILILKEAPFTLQRPPVELRKGVVKQRYYLLPQISMK